MAPVRVRVGVPGGPCRVPLAMRASRGLCEHAALAFFRTILLLPHLIRSTLASAPVGFWCPQAERRSWTPEAGAPRIFLASGRHSGLTGRLLVSTSGARLWRPEAVTLVPNQGNGFWSQHFPQFFCDRSQSRPSGPGTIRNLEPASGHCKAERRTSNQKPSSAPFLQPEAKLCSISSTRSQGRAHLL